MAAALLQLDDEIIRGMAIGAVFTDYVPLHVVTNMATFIKRSFTAPSADTYARAAVRYIGHEPVKVSPYWPHSVMWFLISLLPDSLAHSLRLNMCIKHREMGLAMDAKKKGPA